MKQINELTNEQKAQMPIWRDKWIKIGLRTGESDWETFDKAVKDCYLAAKLPAPKKIIRVSSPLVLSLAAPIASYLISKDSAVRDVVREAVHGAINTAVNVAASSAVHSNVNDVVSDVVSDAVRGVIDDTITTEVHGAVSGVINHTVNTKVHVAVKGDVRDVVDNAVSDVVREAVHGAVDNTVVGAVSDAITKVVLERVNDTIATVVNGDASGAVHSNVSDVVSDNVSGVVGNAVYDVVREAVHDAITTAVHVAASSAVDDFACSDIVRWIVSNAVPWVISRTVRDADGVISEAVSETVSVIVDNAVNEIVNDVTKDMSSYIKNNWFKRFGGQFWVGDWWWGSPSYVSFFTDVCGLELNEEIKFAATAYRKTCESACWWWPHSEFVMVCERPSRITLNEQGQLHSNGKPAIVWPDGWGVWCWDGLRLPEKMQCHTDEWKPEWWLSETNMEIRRVLAEGIGYDRIAATLNLEKVDSWREYELLRIEKVEGEDEPMQFLKMICPSTSKVHFSRVAPNIPKAEIAATLLNNGIHPDLFEGAET